MVSRPRHSNAGGRTRLAALGPAIQFMGNCGSDAASDAGSGGGGGGRPMRVMARSLENSV
jgi:hypothetical protein